MTDYTELLNRLRGVNWVCHTYGKTEIKHDTVCHEAADVIEAQAKRIEELEKEINCWHEAANWPDKSPSQLRSRITELEAALKPFAAVYDENYALIGKWHDGGIQGLFLSDLRAARKALGEKE